MVSRAVFALSFLTLWVLVYGGDISFPVENFNFTSVDTGSKNSGLLLSDDVDDGFIHIGATGDGWGAHLGSAAAAIRALGDKNSSAAVQSLLSVQAMSAQFLLSDKSGQSLAAISLYPYLEYGGGVVMSRLPKSTFNVYVVYYGSKWTGYRKSVVENFIKSISPGVKPKSASERTVYNWWQIVVKNYYDAQKRAISPDVVLKSVYHDLGSASPLGSATKPLTDKNIRTIISNAISKKFKKADSRAVYFVLTDSSTYVTDFCSTSCSYHSSFKVGTTPIAYAHTGDPSTQCPKKCTYQYFAGEYFISPNGLGVDAAVNWMAHELQSVATNPFQTRQGSSGWVVRGSTIELGDFCEWDFGYVGFTKKYGTYNLKGNANMEFLIQRTWNRALKRCTIVGNGKADVPIPF